MTFAMLAKVAASVTDLKKDPRGVLDVGRRDDNAVYIAAQKRVH